MPGSYKRGKIKKKKSRDIFAQFGVLRRGGKVFFKKKHTFILKLISKQLQSIKNINVVELLLYVKVK